MKVPVAVKAIIINRKSGKVLLVKRSDNDTSGAGDWENCGGAMETDAENVILSDEHQAYRWVDREECEDILEKYINEDYVKHGIYEMIWER